MREESSLSFEQFFEKTIDNAMTLVLKLLFWGVHSYTLPGLVFAAFLGVIPLALVAQIQDPIVVTLTALMLHVYPFLVYIPLGASIGYINALPFLAALRSLTTHLAANPAIVDAWLMFAMYVFLAAAIAGLFNRLKEEIMIRKRYRW